MSKYLLSKIGRFTLKLGLGSKYKATIALDVGPSPQGHDIGLILTHVSISLVPLVGNPRARIRPNETIERLGLRNKWLRLLICTNCISL
jgi:hypothetical protein